MRRLKPLFDGMEHYAKVVDILCNGTPFLPWIWAPITLILKISSEYIEAFELLMKGSEFLTNQNFQYTLAVYYADVLQFHKHAYKFVRRSGWQLLFVTSWGRFQRRFDNLLEDLKRHGELIDTEANSHNIVEANRMRKEIRQWREESLDQVERDEEERAASHFRSVLSWLKIDESEQLSICDSIYEEGSKYPGTCSWVTGHSKIRSWLQQKADSPVVWLQGNPGTGKSIASGQIVKFIDNGHTFVIRHFCTYSHVASTKYDNVVKSLLSQLIRGNGELVAHVYQDCILNKKAPTITLLEQLICTLCASITEEPGKVRYLWIVLDGLDECEQNKQCRLLSLMNQILSKSASEGKTVCKLLVSSRPSPIINKYLRKKQVVSLSDETDQLNRSIQMYASQRLLSTSKRLRQLDIEQEDIDELANNVATKAHGMFLYARLVLDYVTSNIFYSADEIKVSINQLPPSLTEFYQKILTQMIQGLDARSVDRVKTILSWVAFAKRPLKKLELLSAVSFGQANPNIDRLVPPYILDICGPLMEERRDATLAFIHVSVKEFLQSAQGRISISERVASREHATATVTSLLAGLRVFQEGADERIRLLQLVRGVHGLHVYATEFWIECLLSDAAFTNGFDVSSDLFALASGLAHQLSAGRTDPLPKELTVQPSDVDERLQLFQQHPLIYEQMKAALNARSRKHLENEMLRQQGHPPPLDGISHMLRSYQQAVELLLNEEFHPGVSAEELENSNVHNPNPAPKSIRRVGQLNGLIRPSVTGNSKREQQSAKPNTSGNAAVNMQTTSNSKAFQDFPSAESVDDLSSDIRDQLFNPALFSDYRDSYNVNIGEGPSEMDQDSFFKQNPYFEPTIRIQHLDDMLQNLLQSAEYSGIPEKLEKTLIRLIGTQTPLTVEDRAILVPPGTPTVIKEELAKLPQVQFVAFMLQACTAARVKRREKADKALPVSNHMDHISSDMNSQFWKEDAPWASSTVNQELQSTSNTPLISELTTGQLTQYPARNPGSPYAKSPFPEAPGASKPNPLLLPLPKNNTDPVPIFIRPPQYAPLPPLYQQQHQSHQQQRKVQQNMKAHSGQQSLMMMPSSGAMTAHIVASPTTAKSQPEDPPALRFTNRIANSNYKESETPFSADARQENVTPACDICFMCEYKPLKKQITSSEPQEQSLQRMGPATSDPVQERLNAAVEQAQQEVKAARQAWGLAKRQGYLEDLPETQRRFISAESKLQLIILERQNREHPLKARCEQDSTVSSQIARVDNEPSFGSLEGNDKSL
ncbi:hypothetical protein N0V90_002143 [Kalmusia sp. IMI 367209]|nr:hypothetical protein N0V90_002143 [Kalmusia sp. IMI 367209]